MLPIDDRLRAVARGQFSRLAQYEIEVENPLRPKEIQARIRAGETVEEIADAAGIPVDRVRWFEGPVLAERGYVAEQAQRASVRRQGDSAPGPRLGEVVAERLTELGADPEDAQWDSRKHGDGSWQVQLAFRAGGRLHIAEWLFDPRRRHVSPADDNAERLSLPEAELPLPTGGSLGAATVTPIRPRPDRREAAPQHQAVAEQVEEPARAAAHAASPSSFGPRARPSAGRRLRLCRTRTAVRGPWRQMISGTVPPRRSPTGRAPAAAGRLVREPTAGPRRSRRVLRPRARRARARPVSPRPRPSAAASTAASTASPAAEQPNTERAAAGHASTERAAAADTSPERSASARSASARSASARGTSARGTSARGTNAEEASARPACRGPRKPPKPRPIRPPPPVARLTAGRSARASPRRSRRPTGTRKTTRTGGRNADRTRTGTRTRPRPVGAARRPPDHADGGRRSPRGTRSCSATRASLTRTNTRAPVIAPRALRPHRIGHRKLSGFPGRQATGGNRRARVTGA